MKAAHGMLGACAAALLGSACATVPPASRPAAMTADAFRAVPQLMDQAIVPGMQIAVISEGKIETRSFGVRDVQTGAPVTDGTVFEAASLGKPVLAYAVLRMASAGSIDLDAPVSRYLPSLSGPVAQLTSRQLLSHTAGLSNNPGARRLPRQ